MRILFVASEVAPFSQTGGLAQVAGSLPKSLAALGHDVSVMTPMYRCVETSGQPLRDTGARVEAPVAECRVAGEVWKGLLPNSRVPVYFIRQPGYFDRDGLYGTPEGGYGDNCERFGFFCRAVLEASRALGLKPDVMHLNDWHTALVAVYLRLLHGDDPAMRRVAALFTVHNMAYQGRFWSGNVTLLGLKQEHFNWKTLEFYGDLSLLKGGLVFADVLNTVSGRYAREIQSEPLGCGLSGVLAERRGDLFGVVNGLDASEWEPATDGHIAARYSVEDLAGKAECKRALQREVGLPETEAPLVGMVARLEQDKGVGLAARAFPQLMARGVQFVLLGKGEDDFHTIFQGLAKQYPRQAAVRLVFDVPLSHRIQAGSDMLLVPSRFEACGLAQLCALRYGTVPIVHETGGLADTVVDATAARRAEGAATGLCFSPHTEEALLGAVDRALELFAGPSEWRRLMLAGMRCDWSWSASARRYVELYERAVGKRRREATR